MEWCTPYSITFDDITMVNSLYGARFKSWVGGQGLVSRAF
jgi:hypothetical protein